MRLVRVLKCVDGILVLGIRHSEFPNKSSVHHGPSGVSRGQCGDACTDVDGHIRDDGEISVISPLLQSGLEAQCASACAKASKVIPSQGAVCSFFVDCG